MKQVLKKIFGKTRLFRFLSERRRKLVKALRNLKLRKYFRNYKQIIPGKKIRVGFIVQLYSLFDKQRSLYEMIRDRTDMEAFLFVVPEDDWKEFSVPDDYSDNMFLRNYPEAIRVHKADHSYINLEDYQLDYLFYPRPYDEHLPEPFKSSHMMKTVRCCYIPYAFTISDVFLGNNIYNHFFCNMYFLFMDSKYTEKLMIREMPYNYRHGLQKVMYLGYPPFDIYLGMTGTHGNHTVTWAPRWSFDKESGRSTFIKYGETFLDISSDPSWNYVFRPHPLLFGEVKKQGLMNQREMDEFISALDSRSVRTDIKSGLDEILSETDILICDLSTIMISYFLSGRPMIYCDEGIEINQIYRDMMAYEYSAHNIEELMELCRMLKAGNDPKYDARQEYIRNVYGEPGNTAEKIAEALLRDAGESFNG